MIILDCCTVKGKITALDESVSSFSATCVFVTTLTSASFEFKCRFPVEVFSLSYRDIYCRQEKKESEEEM